VVSDEAVRMSGGRLFHAVGPVTQNARLHEDIAELESVQRRFTKRLPGLSNVSYSDRLAILGLRSRQVRFLHQDLIFE